MVILRGFAGLGYDWFKCNGKKQNFFHLCFLLFCTKTDIHVFCIFVFFLITFVPIKIQTCKAPQNDHLNLSYVKHEYVNGKKMARYGLKMAVYKLLFFWNSPNMQRASGYI